MKNETIELVVIRKETDQDGFETDVPTSMEVMAEIRSVKRSEFYQAARDGINVQLVAVVNVDDMEASIMEESGKKIKPTMVFYDNVTYKIVREYKTTKATIELTLQEVE